MQVDFDDSKQPSMLDDTVYLDLEGLQASAAPGEPLHPINWFLLTAEEAYVEWNALDQWIKRLLRDSYGLPPTVIPPFWYRHDELVWELSALRLHWLNCHDMAASPSAPLAWNRDFADARNRLREWVATSGTRLDRDRPTRHTSWPSEAAAQPAAESTIIDRDADFAQFVRDDVAARRRLQAEFEARH